MLFGTLIFYLQLTNGNSGQQPIEAFIYAMYDTDMTHFAVSAYVIFNYDVSNAKSED